MVLVESRVPFELVHEALLSRRLQSLPKLLIPRGQVPRCLTSSAPRFDAMSGSGGSLLATFAYSSYNEAGPSAGTFGLADILGVSFTRRIDGPSRTRNS